ncbi:hypothetical protein BH11VER1_BH11VER1_29840 [soil metagenome]
MKKAVQPKNPVKTYRALVVAMLLSNVALVAGCLGLYFRMSAPSATSPSVQLVTSSPPAISKLSKAASENKFHWSELESEDYNVYIARLRNIGCPESTIRDIVQGELHASYAEKRQQLEQQIIHSSARIPPPGMSRQDFLAIQLRKLDKEIDTVTHQLVDKTALSANDPSGKTLSSKPQPSVARLPLAFQSNTVKAAAIPSNSNNSATANQASGGGQTTPEQTAAIQQIQKDFVKNIGGPNQDPGDPAYEKKWLSAQYLADQILRGKIGWAAYGDLVNAAARKNYDAELSKTPGIPASQ